MRPLGCTLFFRLGFMRTSEAATLGVGRELIAIAANQVDDQPDDSYEQDERGEGDEQPEAAGEDGALAVDRGCGSEVEVTGGDCDVATDLRVVAYGEIASEDGYVAGDAMAGVKGDAAEEHRDVTPDVAVNMDRAEGARDVRCGFAFGDGDVIAEAGVVIGV